jgi:tetratricopeptide (TPR) repeat protein
MPDAQHGNGAPSHLAAAAEALRAERPARHPRLREAEKALRENRVGEAHDILTPFLAKNPADAVALHLMAEAALRMNRREKAESLLDRCLALDPEFSAARYNYANALAQLDKLDAALEQLAVLLRKEPQSILYRNLQATVLTALGRHTESLRCYEDMARDFPRSADALVNYGSALRSVGSKDECIAAYHQAIAAARSSGQAYWSLAGLKDYRFSDNEIADMQHELAKADLPGEDRICFHFALGKAYGDMGLYGKSFESYARANALKRLEMTYDADALTNHVRACKALFTREFFEARAESGCDTEGPIFIVGMQRAGSTLIEQILASHSRVEATAELPNISLLAEHLGETIAPQCASSYPGVLAKLDAATLGSLGERYIATARQHRRLGRPFFVDKMPYNFLHIGLIYLILPRARIIDARRHPLGCCFSNFSMYFKSGPLFAYRLGELGRAYVDYVELMAHFDRVLPNRTHRMFYEDLVREPEKEIRRLLDYLGLPFEKECLEFHRGARAMDSASSEQVRRPIYRDAIEQWRHYEPWLGPLKSALGPVLERYPEVPRLAE